MLEKLDKVNGKCSIGVPVECAEFCLGVTEIGNSFVFRYLDPFADNVFIVGSFNGWSESYPMQRTHTGVWSIAIAKKDCPDGSKYKYKVSCDGHHEYVADPYGDITDGEPYYNSVVRQTNGYTWSDESYLESKSLMYAKGFDGQPFHVYEMSIDGWCTDGQDAKSYQNVAKELSVYARQMGYTHVLVGDALSSNCAGDRGEDTLKCYAPNAKFGDVDEFRRFVDVMHGARIGVIVDWNFDNGQDIYSKYGLSSEIVLHWMRSYHIDGVAFTVDGQNGAHLASELSHNVRAINNDAIIIVRGPGAHAVRSADCIVYDEAYGESVLNPFSCRFEQRNALYRDFANGNNHIVGFGQERYARSIPGDEWRAFAGARAAFSSLMTLGGKKHTYMGCEIGMTDEGQVDWTLLDGAYNAGLQLCYSDIGEIYLAHPSLWQSADARVLDDSYSNDGVVLFERVFGDEILLVLVNTSVNAYENRAFFVGERGTYDEIFNSDSERYCGSGVINKKAMRTLSVKGRAVLASLRVPPLAVAVFKKR